MYRVPLFFTPDIVSPPLGIVAQSDVAMKIGVDLCVIPPCVLLPYSPVVLSPQT